MPGRCYVGAPYGCAHHSEHVEAAKKGWRHRRKDDRLRKDLENFRAAYGPVERLHTHASHPGEVRFKLEDRWYSISKDDYEELSLAGRSIRKAEEREKREADRKAERERKQQAKAAEVERRRQERYAAAEARYRERMTREMEQVALREYQALKKELKRRGISPSTHTHYDRRRGREVPIDYGEWELLPKELRRRKGGLHLDAARELAQGRVELGMTEGGGLTVNNFDTIDDLTEYIDRMERYGRTVRTRRRKLKDASAEAA